MHLELKLRKIGKRSPRSAPPIPSTGEPEDIINEVRTEVRVDGVGPYFEMLIQSRSARPANARELTTCPGCGLKTYPEVKFQPPFDESLWDGSDIFIKDGDRRIIATDRVKTALLRLRPTNIEIQPAY